MAAVRHHPDKQQGRAYLENFDLQGQTVLLQGGATALVHAYDEDTHMHILRQNDGSLFPFTLRPPP